MKRGNNEIINAQAKTIEILKRKVYNLYNGGNASFFHKALEASRKREEEMRQKRALIEAQNKMLEQKVKERTEELQVKTNDINSMLQNMNQGILTVMGKNLVHSEYSVYLEEIFETKDIGGQNALDLLFSFSELSSNDKSQIEAALSNIIGEDYIAWVGNCHLFIKEFEITVNHKKKFLEIDWNPIIKDEIVEKVLVVVRDVTELKTLKEVSIRQQRELEIIGQILAIPKKDYNVFIHKSREFISENKRILESAREKSIETVVRLFRNMHTVKGNARFLGFSYLVDVVHLAETEYDRIRLSEDTEWDVARLLLDIDRVIEILNFYEDTYNDKVRSRENKSSLSIENPVVKNARDSVSSLNDEHDLLEVKSVLKRVEHMFEVMETESIEEILEGIIGAMPSLASELQKDHPHIVIDHGNLRVPFECASMLKDVFMHMFRNSIDHGIEYPQERLSVKKSQEGNIYLKSWYDFKDKNLKFEFLDDGRGLNLTKIQETSIKKGLLQEGKYTDEQIANLIFKAGVSTSTQVSRISGRGVGMDAVKGFLNKHGGEIRIEFLGERSSEGFRKFKFYIELPVAKTIDISAHPKSESIPVGMLDKISLAQ